ncbi:hypothetical protein OPV22_023522 [Ensete ventricosum]|uniref:Uncharacterized protein n=1 Tax=Ensete ventricosum TaxID=4639 RepID=A0AAV8PCW5_ENSVE|nr:hypothetical protein OPV22_023522 [Ensete ventricosum]
MIKEGLSSNMRLFLEEHLPVLPIIILEVESLNMLLHTRVFPSPLVIPILQRRSQVLRLFIMIGCSQKADTAMATPTRNQLRKCHLWVAGRLCHLLQAKGRRKVAHGQVTHTKPLR